jgi:hypothetical protein
MRPLQPRKIDLQKWRRLVREVRAVARDPRASSGDLSRAASTACRAVAPTRELLMSTCSPLLRRCEHFCALHPTHKDRPRIADQLSKMAEALAPHVGMGGAAPGAAPADDDGDGDDRPQRKDIFG